MMDYQSKVVEIPAEFQDIAPYNDAQFGEKIRKLIDEPGFRNAITYIMPHVNYDEFAQTLLHVQTQAEFQYKVMGSFLINLENRTTKGISSDGFDNISADRSYTFITNHRDIVLDASFLNLVLMRNNKPLTQVAIGNNLLIYEWIADLVKLNRSFIVKRDVKMKEALEAAKQLSAYIHYTIGNLHESVWIAQREGRAKDSNDLTQESLVKMLSLAGNDGTKGNLLSVNLCPVSISYEYDPNDYLKAREFLLKRRDPQFKKSRRDDLFSMETGIMQNKGRVMFRAGRCINQALEQVQSENRIDIIRATCQLIDTTIHCGYEIYPCNYISYDLYNGTSTFADKYTAQDQHEFEDYVNSQLDKVDIPDVTTDEREYMRSMMLMMYANPLKNKLACDSRVR